MVEAAQIEQRLAFEPRTAPVQPGGEGGSVARESNKPDLTSTQGAPESSSGSSNAAYSVEISNEAQQVAANDSDRGSQPTRQDLNASVETSSTAPIGSNAGASNDASETNQVTSFEGERTGNDTSNETEAGRTLGQVIDTFA
jgi:hypothetical protein